MKKASSKKKGTKAGRKKQNKLRVTMPGRRGLDVYASRYARLLMDPCNGPLEHPVYAGSEAGFLFRAQSVFTVGTGATDTAGYLHWTPGYVNSNNSEILTAAGAAANTTLVAGASGTAGPGKAFLNGNAFGVRCVAACLRIVYPGTEANRSGRIHFGHTQASLVDTGDSVTPDALAVACQSYTRTPPEAMEILWRPGNADQEFNDPSAASSATLRDRKQALTVSWAGLPVAVGLTFYFTAVFEWTPRPGVGVSSNPTGKNPSSNTLDEVIDSIQATGFKWVTGAAQSMGYGLGVGLMTRTFGLMPARARRYNTIAFT